MIRLFYWLACLFDWFDLTARHTQSSTAGSLGERASLVRRLTRNGEAVEFATDHPSLLAKDAAHETRGVLRMHRAGWTGVMICRMFGIAQPSLTREIKDALDEEGSAAAAKRPIYDARVPKGTR